MPTPLLLPLQLAALAFTLLTALSIQAGAPQILQYKIIKKIPHARNAFTQGLAIHQNMLYESAGGYGRSTLSKIALNTGKLLKQHQLPAHYFAEGLTILGKHIYQLSWRQQSGFIYDLSLEQTGRFAYLGQGWGLTKDQQTLIMSNGSANITFLKASNFKELRSITVRDDKLEVEKLNELEWVKGKIYANIWFSNWLIIIDPNSGQVTAKVDLSDLLPPSEKKPDTDVLNGIAYDQDKDELWVTGKRWPWLYQIKLEDIN